MNKCNIWVHTNKNILFKVRKDVMEKKKDKPIDLNNLTDAERMKLEIAEEIGVFDKVMENGWKSLSSRESGRIGGILTSRKRKAKKE